MNRHYKGNERELVKVAAFFKRQSRKLIDEGRLSEEHRKVEEAVDHFITQMEQHANTRAFILEQRETLKKLVKDNAVCPYCHTGDKLKLAGTESNKKGWKSNRYRCRKCNIAFTWNRPNNPWDMIGYIQDILVELRGKLSNASTKEDEKQHLQESITSMEGNLAKFQPVIEAHDKEYNEITTRDIEMEKLIHELKNTLLIEKIKMDTWESKQKSQEKP